MSAVTQPLLDTQHLPDGAQAPGGSKGKAAPAKVAPWSERRAYGILVYCTLLQLLVYADRGIIAGLLNYVEAEFSVNKVESGLLGTIFLAGFMLMSPFSAAVANSSKNGEKSWKVISVGLAVWAVSAAVCGMARNYYTVLLARAAAGCGEAALCSLAPPLIDDSAPPRRKSVFLAAYFSAIFVGLGVGFAVAGVASSWEDAKKIFWAEAIIMAPLCAIGLFGGSCLMMEKAPEGDEDVQKLAAEFRSSSKSSLGDAESQPPSLGCGYETDALTRKNSMDSAAKHVQVAARLRSGYSFYKDFEAPDIRYQNNADGSAACAVITGTSIPRSAALEDPGGVRKDCIPEDGVWRTIVSILKSSVYTFLVCGYCATIFTVGGISFWAPSYIHEVIGTDPQQANSILGVITGLTGLLGTPFGGLLLDAIDKNNGNRKKMAVGVSLALVALACPATWVTAAARSGPLFFGSLAIGQFLVFASTAPCNIAMMEAVTAPQRGLALGLCTLACHLFGDLIPPVLVGYIADATGSLVPGMWLLVLWLLWSVLFWLFAFFQIQKEEKEAKKEADKARKEESVEN